MILDNFFLEFISLKYKVKKHPVSFFKGPFKTYKKTTIKNLHLTLLLPNTEPTKN